MKNKLITLTLLSLLGPLEFPLPVSAQPVVTTLAATGITASGATINGTIIPEGGATTAYFQYGLTTNYGYLGGYVVLPPSTDSTPLTGLVVNSLPGTAGANWTPTSAPRNHWLSIAASADFTRLAAGEAAGNSGFINISGDSGLTWGVFRPLPGFASSVITWYSIASSADGMQLAAVSRQGIVTSVDGGRTWVRTSAPGGDWRGITSSADGTRLAAVSSGSGIWTSTNNGGTWTQTSAPSGNWKTIASSIYGTRLAAGIYGGGIWTSADGGLTWTKTSALGQDWKSIASSADGTRLAAGAESGVGGVGGVWTSVDGGGTWTRTGISRGGSWCVASSADGMRLLAGWSVGGIADYGGIYFSTDGGLTWTESNASGESFDALTLSADGTRAVVAAYGGGAGRPGGGIYTSTAGPSTQLVPGTTYHYRLVGINSAGTQLGNDMTFTTSPVAPLVSTLEASDITTTTAVLNGTVNPGGATTTAYFRYGLTTIYDNSSAVNSLAAVATTLSVPNRISGLAPGTTYHFRLLGINSAGLSLGGDLTFTTAIPFAPLVSTLPASGIIATTATLNGTVNPGGAPTTAYFRYGLTTSYGSYSATNSLALTNATLSISNLLSNLTLGTIYHYQLVASNAVGTSFGADTTFTSSPPVPVVTTLTATSVMATSATLNGTVNPGYGTATAYFEYGLTTSYGNIGQFTILPATNTTLTIPGLVVSSLTSAAGAAWVQSSAPSDNVKWASIASSADGTRLVAVDEDNKSIYTSSDSGGTWTQTDAPSEDWNCIASSTDGTRLVAGVFEGGIWSSADGGRTWTQTSAPGGNWNSIASSADGARLAAGAEGDVGVWTSADGGGTWTQSSAPLANGQFIASSADGSRLAAVAGDGPSIYTSTDRGATWTETSAPGKSWFSIASSADGTRLAAVAHSGGIWTSTDGGGAWTQSSAPSDGSWWESIASSADGIRLAAVGIGDGIWTSTNVGGTWAQSSTPSDWWYSIASSADGTRLVAGNLDGIYTSTGSVNALTQGTIYHYRLVAINSAGISLGGDQTFITGLNQSVAINLTGRISGGAFQLSFTHPSNLHFTVLTSTNLGLPLSNWTVLGTPIEAPPGQYQFDDVRAPDNTHRFYRVRSP